MSIDAWTSAAAAAAPEPLLPATCGAVECDHPQCEVAHTGGALICALAGGDYTTIGQPARDHYAAIAFAAMTAMWDRAVEVGLTADLTIIEEPT